jgi:hypothetical protein
LNLGLSDTQKSGGGERSGDERQRLTGGTAWIHGEMGWEPDFGNTERNADGTEGEVHPRSGLSV